MGRYNWGDDAQSSQSLGLAGSKTVTNYKQWSGSNTRTLSSTLVNDARFGYTKFFNSIGTLSAFTNDVVGDLKIPNLKSGDPVTWGIPQRLVHRVQRTSATSTTARSPSTTTRCSSSTS